MEDHDLQRDRVYAVRCTNSAAGWKTTIRSEIVSMQPTGGTAELVLMRVLSPTA